MFKNNERFPLQPLSIFFLFVCFIFGIFFTLLPFLMNSTTIPFTFLAHLSANQHLTKARGIYRTTHRQIYLETDTYNKFKYIDIGKSVIIRQ